MTAASTADSDDDGGGALDVIVDGLRNFIALDARAFETHATVAKLSSSLFAWIETLAAHVSANVSISDQNDSSNSDDDADAEYEDILDVWAMLLVASASNDWRQHLQRAACNDPFTTLLFPPKRMHSLLQFLARYTATALNRSPSADATSFSDAVLTLCELVDALGRLALSESDTDVLLAAIRSTALLSGTNAVADWRAVYARAPRAPQRLAICYTRFILASQRSSRTDTVATASAPLPVSSESILKHLVGDDVAAWRQHNWEQAPLLLAPSSRSTLLDALLGVSGPSDGNALVQRLLRGLSVPQVATDDDVTLQSLASFLFALPPLDALLPLRHCVDVTLVRNGAVHPNWPAGAALATDAIHAAVVTERFTVGMRSVHARALSIAQLCQTFERELQQHVNANLYWTPANQQGFDLHIDDHCVFIVQLQGSKHWRLEPHVQSLPPLYSRLAPLIDRGASRLTTTELTLTPGDVLYMPRGTPHCANTRGFAEASIHVTIGVDVEAPYTKQAFVVEVLTAQQQQRRGEEDATETAADAAARVALLDAAIDSNSNLQTRMRGGLMAWHIETVDALGREVASLLDERLCVALMDAASDGQDDTTLDATLRLVRRTRAAFVGDRQLLKQTHDRVVATRDAFLTSRDVWSRAFAQLHAFFEGDDVDDENVGSESSRLIRPAICGDDTEDERNDQDPSRASSTTKKKRQRL